MMHEGGATSHVFYGRLEIMAFGTRGYLNSSACVDETINVTHAKYLYFNRDTIGNLTVHKESV